MRDGPPRPEDRQAGWATTSTTRTRNAKPSPVTEKILHDFVVKSKPSRPRKISDEEILEHCVYPMINEGANILDEGKAIRPSDIDVVWGKW